LSGGPIGKAGNEAASNESHNRFERLGDLEPDMIQALNIEEDEEAALDPSPYAPETSGPWAWARQAFGNWPAQPAWPMGLGRPMTQCGNCEREKTGSPILVIYV
jgi:hypothetical protein